MATLTNDSKSETPLYVKDTSGHFTTLYPGESAIVETDDLGLIKSVVKDKPTYTKGRVTATFPLKD